jgi:hypothetical protein
VIAVISNPGNGTNWGDVYVSNSMDSDFSLSLKHVPLGRTRMLPYSFVFVIDE